MINKLTSISMLADWLYERELSFTLTKNYVENADFFTFFWLFHNSSSCGGMSYGVEKCFQALFLMKDAENGFELFRHFFSNELGEKLISAVCPWGRPWLPPFPWLGPAALAPWRRSPPAAIPSVGSGFPIPAAPIRCCCSAGPRRPGAWAGRGRGRRCGWSERGNKN